VRTLALGAQIVTIALVLDIILAVILGGLMTRLSLPPLLPTLLNYSIALVALVGYWKATEPDPSAIEDSSNLTERRLVRITMVVAIALSFASSFAWTGRTPIMSVLLPIAAGIVGVVKLIALFSYARQMALRIPDHKMAKQCKVIMTGLLIMLAIGFVGGAAMRTSRAAGGVGPAVCVIGLVSLILVLASIRLLLRFRKAFQEAARFAAANWAAEPPGA
jgi:hypothetical protein